MLVMSEKVFYKEPLRRAVKNHDIRASEEGVKEIKRGLEMVLEEIIKDSKKYTEHAGRKTIKEEDVKQALQELDI